MSAMELLPQIIGVNLKKFSKSEIFIIEAECLTRIYVELRDFFKNKFKDYFQIMKFNMEMESAMLETNFLRNVINDILITEEYSLEGIAYYTQTPEEVISDVAVGKNTAPSLQLSQKIINLHKSLRPHLYQEIMKKVVLEYAEQN